MVRASACTLESATNRGFSPRWNAILIDLIPSAAKAGGQKGNSMYGLKPVPFISYSLFKCVCPDQIVMLRAVISKDGNITNLNAICGPQILLEASLKAIQQWKYRPYLVHGDPVEIDTTIRVEFALGGTKKVKFSPDSCPVQ